MSFRSWLYVVAFGITLLASEAGSQTAAENEPRQENSAADTETDGESNYPDPIDFTPALENIESAIRDLIAEEDKIEAQRKQDSEKRDLDAQEQMAKWAFWMTLATVGGVLATFVGLALIGRTLHHTKRAADYTEGMLKEAAKTTAAAESATAETRRVGEAQIRAYITLSEVSLMIDQKRQPVIQVCAKNTGVSPTRRTTIHAACEFGIGGVLPDGFDITNQEHLRKLPQMEFIRPKGKQQFLPMEQTARPKSPVTRLQKAILVESTLHRGKLE